MRFVTTRPSWTQILLECFLVLKCFSDDRDANNYRTGTTIISVIYRLYPRSDDNASLIAHVVDYLVTTWCLCVKQRNDDHQTLLVAMRIPQQQTSHVGHFVCSRRPSKLGPPMFESCRKCLQRHTMFGNGPAPRASRTTYGRLVYVNHWGCKERQKTPQIVTSWLSQKAIEQQKY